MSGILKRTALMHNFRDKSGGNLVMMHDYAKVTTQIGGMIEAGSPFRREHMDMNGHIAYDPINDMIARVDDIEFVHVGKEKSIFSDAVTGIALHGGSLMPRTGW